ncbi:MAG TPA: S8 family serine peptidase [Terracidiphilus sp.]|nr:S8 family serine peptidase [Terracidiphilus sp.]
MNDRNRLRIFGLALFALLSLWVVSVPASRCLAQTTAKKVVKTEADLPRFNYEVSGTATGLLKSDDATFNVFAAKVKSDVDSVLANYDIEDHASMRELLGVRLDLQLLAGDNKDALETVARLRALEDKPDAKLMTGLLTKAMIEAQDATGKTTGPEYVQAFQKAYAAQITPLPWAVVADSIKEGKSRAEIVTPALVMGSVQANVEPALAKTHHLSNDLAWGLIGARLDLMRELALMPAVDAVLSKEVAANNVVKPEIWAAREVTLTAADKLTPVRVAIWDSGSDLSLFPGRVYTVAHPAPGADPHDIAFDLKGFPSHGYLYPLTPEQQKEFPGTIGELKGFSDLQLSIDSPEATALRKKLAHIPASEVGKFIEQIELFAIYSHGTHVAGIAARGNPAIRLAVGRITFDWHNVPLPPSEELSRRDAKDDQAYVDWFKANHIRVVNMSWGGGPQDDEVALEKNGMGKDAADRKAIAAKLFGIEREGLYNAIKSAPGILFICAAGNSDSNSTFLQDIPSSFKLPNMLAVGAVDQAGDEASFTSYGPTVKVDADGYQVQSVVPGGEKLRMSGTSMASPNTVNLAAKLIALDPKLTPEQTVHLIVAGSTASADGRRHNIDEKRSVELLKQMESSSAKAVQ